MEPRKAQPCEENIRPLEQEVDAPPIRMPGLVGKKRREDDCDTIPQILGSYDEGGWGAEVENFRVMADLVPHMIWSARPDGFIDYFNRRLLEYMGMTLEQVKGWNWAEALHPEDRMPTLTAMEESLRSGADYRVDYRIRNARTGQYRWFQAHAVAQRDEAGSIVRWYGANTDIEERKRVEQHLKESEERLFRFIGAMDEVAIEFDTKGCILQIWLGDEKLLKIPSRDHIGKRVDEVMPPELAERIFSSFRRVRETAEPECFEYLLEIRGGVHWFHARIALVPPRRGAEPTFSFLSRDVTRLHKLSEQMETYLQMLAHDLRTPLTLIFGYAEILQGILEGTEFADASLSSTRAILDAAEQMRQMMEDLVDFGYLESGQITLHDDRIDLVEFISDFLRRQQVAREYRRVRLSVPSEVRPVRMGFSHLERVVSNVIGNALKYTPPDLPVDVEVVCTAEGSCLVVQDFGEGISPEDQTRIFERFFRGSTGRRTAGGTGLGLYITHSLLSAYGGDIRLDSEPGEGARFTLRLPTA